MDNNMLDYCLKCLLYILLHSVDIGRDIGFSGEREKKTPTCATNFITMSSLYRVHLATHVNKIHKYYDRNLDILYGQVRRNQK